MSRPMSFFSHPFSSAETENFLLHDFAEGKKVVTLRLDLDLFGRPFFVFDLGYGSENVSRAVKRGDGAAIEDLRPGKEPQN